MTHPTELKTLSVHLLAEDRSLSARDYEEYRATLTRRIAAARRTERIAYWVCVVSGVISFVLMFIGGSKVAGDFDPWSKEATTLSLVLAAVFLCSTVLFCTLLASYYSRFRPQTRQVQESFRDLRWAQLEVRVEALQKDVALLLHERMRHEPAREPEKSPPTE